MKNLLAVLFMFFALVSYSQERNDDEKIIPQQVIVQLEPHIRGESFFRKGIAKDDRVIEFVESRLLSKHLNIWQATYVGDFSERDVVYQLSRDKDVQIAQLNHQVSLRKAPNDPFFGDQWHWQNIDAESAWDITTGGLTANGDTIVVAIIDDGTNLTHPDLAANLWYNYAEIQNNGIDDDNNGYVDDFQGWNVNLQNDQVGNGNHGTSVEGMIGAVGDDGNQGVGANWSVKMMTIVGGPSSEADVIASYSYALDFRKKYNETNGQEGAFVVATNSSWGIDYGDPNDSPLWCGFYDTLGAYGILSCAATSNDSYDVDILGDMPTTCPSEYLLSVTATNSSDVRTFSAWGLEHVDLASPGDDVYTTNFLGGYEYESGTSLASPLTAGVVALLYAAPCSNIADLALSDPPSAAGMIRDFIFDGVDETEQLLGETKTGGRINAGNSMSLLMGTCGSCPAPLSVSAINLTDTQADIQWVSLSDTTTLYYRPQGSTTWVDVQFAQSPYTITGLTGCSFYEVQLQSVCGDSLSDFSSIYSFQTDGCCDLPDDFVLTAFDDHSASFQWGSVLAATGYELIWSEEPYTTWDTVHVESTSYTISDLSECSSFQVKVRTVCDGNIIEFSEPITVNTMGCGACLDLDYCAGFENDPSFEWIDSVSIAGIMDNPSGLSADGYEEFTDLDIYLTKGETYEITLTPGFDGFTYFENFKVWIDYNQDGQFDDSSEVVVDPGFSVDQAIVADMTISEDALAGFTRMRVMMNYEEITGSCGFFDYGEVEDYCVWIEENIYCYGPEEIEVSDIGYYSSSLSWDKVNDGLTYIVHYRESGASEWEEESTANNGYELTNLENCTTYEVEVRAICENGLGEYVTTQFTTECVTNTLTPIDANQWAVSPNPFDDYIEVNIAGYNNDDVQFRLVSSLGQVIPLDVVNTGTSTQVSYRLAPKIELAQGMYLLQMKSGKNFGSKRIIKF